MNAIALGVPRLSTLLRLGRVSNLPTVWTNVVAGSVIAGGYDKPDRMAMTALAMTAFYVGGMFLNDFFDREVDARERPGRPIHAGEINAGTVAAIGFALLAAGVLLMAPFGLLPLLLGLALAGMIVLYDVWHKGNPLSPLIMGACRALVYLGAGAVVAGEVSIGLGIAALVLASHVAGLTFAAKRENLDGVEHLWPLLLLALPLIMAFPAEELPAAIAFALLLGADGFAVSLLVRRPAPGAVIRAVSILIAAICLVDAVAVAAAGGGVLLVLACAAGFALTRLLQTSIPGT
jgi:4-hydroxybenzoate polyprenyltransferase